VLFGSFFARTLAYFQCIASNIAHCEKPAKWSNFKAVHFHLLEMYADSDEKRISMQ